MAPCSLLFLCITLTFTALSHTSEARRHVHNKPPTAAVVGTVYCDACFGHGSSSSKPTHFVSGASIAVKCGKFRRVVETNQRGEFSVQLPFTADNKEVTNIQSCSVKLLTSKDPYCSVASTATSSSLRLMSRNEKKLGSDIYFAGYFTIKPSRKDTSTSLCSQQRAKGIPAGNEQKDLSGFPALPYPGGGGDDDEPALPPPVVSNPQPPEMNQNRLPQLPLLPRLPPLPTLPRLPFLPPWPGKRFSKHGKPSLRQGEEEGEGDGLSDQKSGRPGQPEGFSFPPSPPSLPLPPNPLEPPSLEPPTLPLPSFPFPFPPPSFTLPPGVPGIPAAPAYAAHKSKSKSKSKTPSTVDP